MSRTGGFIIVCVFVLAVLVGCGQRSGDATLPESKEAKQLLQGMWCDKETESVVFLMKGDSVYYPDSTSMPISVSMPTHSTSVLLPVTISRSIPSICCGLPVATVNSSSSSRTTTLPTRKMPSTTTTHLSSH